MAKKDEIIATSKAVEALLATAKSPEIDALLAKKRVVMARLAGIEKRYQDQIKALSNIDNALYEELRAIEVAEKKALSRKKA